ncbi:hypothetical protein CPB85DRAFT_1326263 [Mucidula mucida]|nr:hypothetical protein CPB85DRAFT_1326263 [Mucidula mucida]
MPVVPTIDNTLGLLYDAIVISAALFGAGCLQGWFYFRKYSQRDALPLRVLVGFVLFCDVVQMALLTASVYRYTVTFHGDNTLLNVLDKNLAIELFFSGAIALSTQLFYSWRILVLSKNWILVVSVASLGLGSYVILLVYTVTVLQYEFLTDLLKQVPMSSALNGLGAACDLAITVIMVIFLERSKTGFRMSTGIINRLIIFTFNTGIPTTICALLSLIFLNAIPHTSLYIFFYVIMGRFYTNSLLVTLNSRDYIRDGRRSEGSTDHDISLNGFGTTGAFAHSANRIPNSGRKGPQEISIRIDTISHQEAGIDSKEYPEEEHQSGKVAV